MATRKTFTINRKKGITVSKKDGKKLTFFPGQEDEAAKHLDADALDRLEKGGIVTLGQAPEEPAKEDAKK